MTVKYYEGREALVHGKITEKPLRERPSTPSWVLKLIMAVTGVIFGLFVFVHMVGNLKVFLPDTNGVNHINDYAHFLRTMGEPLMPAMSVLWIFRIVLFVSIVLHIYSALTLYMRGRESRGKFRRSGLIGGLNSFAARTMVVTGIVLLLFIIFHLLDLTIGAQPMAPATWTEGDAFGNLIGTFSRWPVALIYIVAMLILFLHLSHGLWTAVSDLGIVGRKWRATLLFISYLLPAAVLVGNIVIPIAVLAGWIG